MLIDANTKRRMEHRDWWEVSLGAAERLSVVELPAKISKFGWQILHVKSTSWVGAVNHKTLIIHSHVDVNKKLFFFGWVLWHLATSLGLVQSTRVSLYSQQVTSIISSMRSHFQFPASNWIFPGMKYGRHQEKNRSAWNEDWYISCIYIYTVYVMRSLALSIA